MTSPYENLVRFINSNCIYQEERVQALRDLEALTKIYFKVEEDRYPQTVQSFSNMSKDKLKVEMRISGWLLDSTREFWPGQLDDEDLRAYVIDQAKRELVEQVIKQVGIDE